MRNTLLLLACLFSFVALAQKKQKIQKYYDLLDAKMDKMPIDSAQSISGISNYIKANFISEADRIRAVYYWTANTISYDDANMFEVNFDESGHERTERSIKTQKGTCVDYSNIFNQLATAVGIKSVFISGYTKSNKVKIDNLSHAWNAARIDRKWYLFDVTWGAGYVINGIFTRRLDNKHFKVNPEIMINTHMPFDYLWQFREYPINNQEFMAGVYSGNEAKEKFDFVNEIAKLDGLSKLERLSGVADRIEKGGMKNQHVARAFLSAKTAWKNENQNTIVKKRFKEIVEKRNQAVGRLNEFMRYRDKRFEPLIADWEIKKKIENPRNELVKCQEELVNFEKQNPEYNKVYVDGLKNAISVVLANAEEHLQFVNTYLTKSAVDRRTMFYTTVVRKGVNSK